MNKTWSLFALLIFFLSSCIESRERKIKDLVELWNGKELLFPDNWRQYVIADSCLEYDLGSSKYAIISYVDSNGCIDCRLNLPEWKNFVYMLDSVSQHTVPVLFVFNPKSKQYLIKLLKRIQFPYPAVVDDNDDFNKLNHFPDNMDFQTFLLDIDNQVVAIGNPILNPKVKELYLKIIQGETIAPEDKSKQITTQVDVDQTTASMGNFDWQEEQKATFTLKNTGNKPLVIQDITTSCGCTTVSYAKTPVRPGAETTLEVSYKAERPGHFDKTVTVYCNAEHSPLILKIKGKAQ